MCGAAALSVASFAISAVSTMAQQRDASMSADAQKQMVLNGLARDRAATQRQYEEINKSAMDESARRRTEHLIDQARLRAIGGEAGVWGATQERIYGEAENDAEADLATIEGNRQRQAEQAHTQGLAQSTQAGVQLSGIRRPSAIGSGLQIVGAGVSAYNAWDQSQRKAAEGVTQSRR